MNNSREGREVTGSFGIFLTVLWGGYFLQHFAIFSGPICLRIYLYCYHSKKDILAVGRKTVGSVWSGLCGKNKNGLHSLPCYFLVNGLLYCPPSLSMGEEKHSELPCDMQASKQVLIHYDWAANLVLVPLYQYYILYSCQKPPTRSLTPTQVRPKLFTPLWRAISHTLITQCK